MDDVVCLRCDGEGRQVWDEDGVRCLDACYACCGRGWVDGERGFAQALEAACDRLGAMRAARYRRGRDEGAAEGDCEDFSFCAAENMMSARDYEVALSWDFAAEAMREVADWPLDRQRWLVALGAWGRS